MVADIADTYSRAGIAHVVEPDIKRRTWTKLMMNVGVNQTCMVYGGTYGSATERGSEQRRSLVAAMREARVVANAEGIAIAEADLSQMVELLETLDPAGMPSMAQDRIARRKTEVEEFSGTICRLAAEHGIEVPQRQNGSTQRIREIERAGSGLPRRQARARRHRGPQPFRGNAFAANGLPACGSVWNRAKLAGVSRMALYYV